MVPKNPTATAWTTPENSASSRGGDGSVCWTPNYVAQTQAHYPELRGAPWGVLYYVAMAPADIADAIGNNWQDKAHGVSGPNNGANAAYIAALEALEPKYGPLYSWQRDTDPATWAYLLNYYGLATNWPTRCGTFDFRTLPPGVPTGMMAYFPGVAEAPADSPVPPTWPAAVALPPEETTGEDGKNAEGNYVGKLLNALVTTPWGPVGALFESLPGNPNVDGSVVTADGRLMPNQQFKLQVQATPMGTGRSYYLVARGS